MGVKSEAFHNGDAFIKIIPVLTIFGKIYKMHGENFRNKQSNATGFPNWYFIRTKVDNHVKILRWKTNLKNFLTTFIHKNLMAKRTWWYCIYSFSSKLRWTCITNTFLSIHTHTKTYLHFNLLFSFEETLILVTNIYSLKIVNIFDTPILRSFIFFLPVT